MEPPFLPGSGGSRRAGLPGDEARLRGTTSTWEGPPADIIETPLLAPP